MMSASPDLIRLLAIAAGMAFELALIATLNIAVASAVIASSPRHPLRGALGGIAVLVILVALLLFAGPLETLGGYARCIDPASPRCSLAGAEVDHGPVR
jgi:hypothetical protein